MYFFFFFLFFFFLRAALVAYGGSHARGQIRAIASGLRHSNARFKLHLKPTPQPMEMLDP